MIRHGAACLVLGLFAGGCHRPIDAQSPKGTLPLPATLVVESPKAVVLCSNTTPDEVKLHFDIKNIKSQETMQLRVASRSCLCINAELSRTTLAPGEDGEVDVFVRPRPGEMHVKVDISTGIEQPSIISVRGIIEGLPELALEPSEFSVVDVAPDKDASFTFKVHRAWALPQRGPSEDEIPIVLKSTDPQVVLSDVSSTESAVGSFVKSVTHCRGYVTPSEGMSVGRIERCIVSVGWRDLKADQVLAWRKVGRVRVMPSAIYVLPDAHITPKEYRLRLVSDQPFVIEGVSASNHKFVITRPQASHAIGETGVRHMADLLVAAGSLNRSDAGRHTILITSRAADGKDEETVTVPILVSSLPK